MRHEVKRIPTPANIERGRIFAGTSYISVEMASQLGARFLFSDITITHEEVSSTIDSRRRQMRAMMTEDLCSNIMHTDTYIEYGHW